MTVLFACTHNAGRSQMAAALFNRATQGRAHALSAGTRPGGAVHPVVRDAMAEVGIDLSGARPQRLTDALARQADLLVTMGCGEECPVLPGLKRIDWPLDDPNGQSIETVRAIRDEIQTRVDALVSQLGLRTGQLR
jgi:arsenate reductase